MKIFNKGFAIALSIFMAFSTSSCDDDDKSTTTPSDPLAGYVALGTKTINSGAWKVDLLMMEDPFVGYNYIAVKLIDVNSDLSLSGADVSFLPMMDMGMMMHTCPFENPTYSSDLGAFSGTSTFIMPSMAGTWMMNVIVNESGVIDTASFAITVVQKPESQVYSFLSDLDSTKAYFVALKQPMNPVVGMNNFEIMIYKRESMMSFPAVDDAVVEIDPQMPSMGHGSPNNVNPIHISNGLYQGKVNFTMTGSWDVNISIFDNSQAQMDDKGKFNIILN